MPYKTSKKDFEFFKKECLKWQKILELNNFELIFKHENLDQYRIDGGCAEISPVGYATITLDTEIDDKNFCGNAKKELERTASHEMVHILTSDLEAKAYNRYASREDIYESNEALVRKIEYLIRKYAKKNSKG